MSLYDYRMSQELAKKDYGFYAMIMGCMRKSDSNNEMKLKACWPEIWEELFARYNAPGGFLDTDPEMKASAEGKGEV